MEFPEFISRRYVTGEFRVEKLIQVLPFLGGNCSTFRLDQVDY